LEDEPLTSSSTFFLFAGGDPRAILDEDWPVDLNIDAHVMVGKMVPFEFVSSYLFNVRLRGKGHMTLGDIIMIM
jgi:hypothetical protein